MTKIFPSPYEMIQEAGQLLLGPRAKRIKPEKWQGLPLSHRMIEVFDTVLRCEIPEILPRLQILSKADLPWAEDHFQERVGEKPTNPGNTFHYWPYYKEDENIRKEIFTHTYQERFWPKKAGNKGNAWTNNGIRYEYGDYFDMIVHLAQNPTSRQVFLPIWFPEDTGVKHKGRVPCTIGYLFSHRDGYLHITYYLRSCDYIRHFHNDVYLACRLAQHTLQLLQTVDSPLDWTRVRLGRLKMDIESLHIFESDILELNKRINQ